jgi:hypothetical protein
VHLSHLLSSRQMSTAGDYKGCCYCSQWKAHWLKKVDQSVGDMPHVGWWTFVRTFVPIACSCSTLWVWKFCWTCGPLWVNMNIDILVCHYVKIWYVHDFLSKHVWILVGLLFLRWCWFWKVASCSIDMIVGVNNLELLNVPVHCEMQSHSETCVDQFLSVSRLWCRTIHWCLVLKEDCHSMESLWAESPLLFWLHSFLEHEGNGMGSLQERHLYIEECPELRAFFNLKPWSQGQ